MKLYLIRHGQSEANVQHYFGGQTQVELTEEGKKQATKLGSVIGHINFDKIYSSDLHRAMDTQKLALPDQSCEITTLLREIDVGCIAGVSVDECINKYGDQIIFNRKNYNFVPYGGENCEMVKERFEKFLNIITKSGHETIAAFCHGGYIVSAMEYILDIPLNKDKLESKNCSVTIFEYINGEWKLDLYNYTGLI